MHLRAPFNALPHITGSTPKLTSKGNKNFVSQRSQGRRFSAPGRRALISYLALWRLGWAARTAFNLPETPRVSTEFSSRTPQQALAGLLQRYAPQRLLVVGAQGLPAVQAFCAAHPHSQLSEAPAAPLSPEIAGQRFDLAIVVDCLEHLPKRSGLELLGGIRNLNASRMAVLVDLAASDWRATDLFALALQATERFQRDEQVVQLFTYDLHEYKQVPDWLNARFWANPENFGKYWW